MITYGINGVKTALLGLKDQAGAAIFAAASEIYTGYPNPDMIRPPMPTAGKPIVAVHFHATNIKGLGYNRVLSRDADDVGLEHHTRDTLAVAEGVTAADIYIFAGADPNTGAGGMDELVGTVAPLWYGYVEQIILLVRSHALIIGPAQTAIRWDLVTWDVPGTVVDATDRRLQLGVVNTTLDGKFVPMTPTDGAKVNKLYPHDGKFTPVP